MPLLWYFNLHLAFKERAWIHLFKGLLDLWKSVSFHQFTAAEDKTAGFRNVVRTLGLIIHIHTYSWNREDSSPPYIFFFISISKLHDLIISFWWIFRIQSVPDFHRYKACVAGCERKQNSAVHDQTAKGLHAVLIRMNGMKIFHVIYT